MVVLVVASLEVEGLVVVDLVVVPIGLEAMV